jgi:hypothetical protein
MFNRAISRDISVDGDVIRRIDKYEICLSTRHQSSIDIEDVLKLDRQDGFVPARFFGEAVIRNDVGANLFCESFSS